jgi:hypothetical protein
MSAASLPERVESLRRAVEYGLARGKTNLVVDLDLLADLLRAQQQRDDLLRAARQVIGCLSRAAGDAGPTASRKKGRRPTKGGPAGQGR